MTERHRPDRHWSNPFCTRFVRPGAIPYDFGGGFTGTVADQTADACADQDNDASQRIIDVLRVTRFGLIVGPHGTGKTTLLHQLQDGLVQRFSSVQNVRLVGPLQPSALRRWRQTTAADKAINRGRDLLKAEGVLVVDGLEQLSFIACRRLIRAALRRSLYLLATSHQPIASIPTIWQTNLSWPVVVRLTESLIAGQPQAVRQQVLTALRACHRGNVSNLRDLWFDLYDVAQATPETDQPSPAASLELKHNRPERPALAFAPRTD